MTEAHHASIRGSDAALREQLTDGAIGNTAFAERSNVVLDCQQPGSTRRSMERKLRRSIAEALQRIGRDDRSSHGNGSMIATMMDSIEQRTGCVEAAMTQHLAQHRVQPCTQRGCV